ncbi:MAG TPA: cytochrome b/b6 domain-containing protein [Bacteroidia bacterium]|nr:cytochrome b/b6 domain-containing protein [Bacteroidia bacterium]
MATPGNKPMFGGKHSRSMRLWHWSTFIIIMGSLATVLLAKTLFNTRSNIALVKGSLQENNITVTDQQARSVSHEFNDLVWHWHIYIGYVLAGLFVFRLIFEFFQPTEQKLIPTLKRALNYLKLPGTDKKETKHYIVVKFLYLFFYFALFIQTCTGLFMVYSDDVENLKSIRHTASDIHSVFMWVIITYIVMHIGGVILAESGKNKGIVSKMINGGK